MHFKHIILSLLTTITLTLSAPTNNNPTNLLTFTALTIHSGSLSLHLRTILADDKHFFINLSENQTSTYCPPDIPQLSCSSYSNYTIFITNTASLTLSLDVAVPGGQQVYVEKDGALGYTTPHSTVVPMRGEFAGFELEEGSGSVGKLRWRGGDWFACPAEDGNVYQIYAADNVTPEGKESGGCEEVVFGTVEYKGNMAYEYGP